VLIDFEDSSSVDIAGSDKMEISMTALVIQIPEKSKSYDAASSLVDVHVGNMGPYLLE
jgi:hypothetical protein